MVKPAWYVACEDPASAAAGAKAGYESRNQAKKQFHRSMILWNNAAMIAWVKVLVKPSGGGL